MADQNVTVGLDVNDVIAGAQRYIAALNSQNKAVTDLAATLGDFNKKGEARLAVVKGIIDGENQIEVVLRKTKKGFEATSATITKATAEINKLTAAQKAAISALATDQIRNAFPVPSTASVTQLRGYEIAISNVQKALERGRISQEDFNRILGKAKTGDFSPQGVKGEGQAKLLSDLQLISKAFGDNERAAKGFLLTTKDLFRIAEATIFKNVLGAISSEFTNGVRSALEYQIVISQIRTISQDSQLSFEGWANGIREVSDLFGLSQADVAQAAYDAVSNQVVRGAEAFKFLATAAELARISQSKLSDTQNILSSVINSYNLSVSDAEQLSAELFKTVDLGRIKLSEISNTIGRTTFLGNALGVSFQEIEASLATLTIQGVRTSEAETFLTNVFQKLLKPTEAAQRLLNSFGVSSGDAAVKTFGFAGTIEKLFHAFKAGDAEAGDFFNEIRGRKGFEGLTNFAGLFEKNLGKITNSVQDYANAKKIRAESPADFLTKEFNRIRNIFIDDIGQDLLKGTASFIEGVKPLIPAFKDLFTVVKVGAATITIYQGVMLLTKGVTLAAALANGTLALSTTTYTAATIGATVATISFRTALLTSGIGGIAVGIGLAVSQLAAFGSQAAELDETSKRLSENNKRFSKLNFVESAENNFASLKTTTEKNFSSILQTFARVSIAVDGSLDGTRTKIEAITTALNTQFEVYENNLKAGLSRLQSIITQSRGEIEKSQKVIQDITQKSADEIFNFQIQVATPDQQLELTKKKIQDLVSEAQQLSKPLPRKGKETDEDFIKNQEQEQARIAESRQKFNEARTLTVQVAKIEVELAKEALRLSGESGVIKVSSLSLQKGLNDLTQIQLNVEQQITREQERRFNSAKALKTQEELKADITKKAFEDFSKFSVTNKEGTVKPEFTDKVSGKVLPDLILADFQKRADVLRGSLTGDSSAQLQVLQLIENKKTAIIAEAQQLRTKLILEEERKRIEQQKKTANDEIKAIKEKQRTTSEQTLGKDGAADQIKDQLGTVKKFLQTLIGGELSTFGVESVTSKQTTNPIRETIKLVEEQLKKTQTNADTVNGLPVARPEDGAKLTALVQQLRIQLNAAGRKQGISALTDTALSGTDLTLGSILSNISEQANKLTDSGGIFKKTGEDLAFLQLTVENLTQSPTLKQLNLQFPELQKTGELANQALQTGFNGTLLSVKALSDAVDSLNKKLGELGLSGIVGNNKDNVVPLRRAMGGTVPGGPRGTDTVPAWLTPNEFVVNARSAARFRPVLEAINNAPKYLSSGGSVSNTNVGDINIHLAESGGNSNKLVTEFGNKLRRAVKQGRVKL